tara:strand:- start:11636 stop:11842 length:207 start_codon:yes stop_codon:yes gene_type:complete
MNIKHSPQYTAELTASEVAQAIRNYVAAHTRIIVPEGVAVQLVDIVDGDTIALPTMLNDRVFRCEVSW